VWRLDWQTVHETFQLPRLALRIEELNTIFKHTSMTPWQIFHEPSTEGKLACLIEPPSLDARIVAQAGAFTLCTSTSESFDHFLDRHQLKHTLTKFVIPSKSVARFRDQLDLVGVDERRLFPDLDGVSAALRRYYM
jgi:hypothetical protein